MWRMIYDPKFISHSLHYESLKILKSMIQLDIVQRLRIRTWGQKEYVMQCKGRRWWRWWRRWRRRWWQWWWCWGLAAGNNAGVSGNSRSRISGMFFFHSLPVLELREWVFFNSLPVPKLWEWNYPFPFPFPNSQMSFPLTPGLAPPLIRKRLSVWRSECDSNT